MCVFTVYAQYVIYQLALSLGFPWNSSACTAHTLPAMQSAVLGGPDTLCSSPPDVGTSWLAPGIWWSARYRGCLVQTEWMRAFERVPGLGCPGLVFAVCVERVKEHSKMMCTRNYVCIHNTSSGSCVATVQLLVLCALLDNKKM